MLFREEERFETGIEELDCSKIQVEDKKNVDAKPRGRDSG